MPNYFLAALLFAAPLLAADVSSCRAEFAGGQLTLANSHIERKWQVKGGLLYATSLKDLDTGREWLAKSAPQPAPYPSARLSAEPGAATLTKRTGKLSPVEAESLIAELSTGGAVKLTYRFQIFPDAHGVAVRLIVPAGNTIGSGPAGLGSPGGVATGIEAARPAAGREPALIEDALENLDLAAQHLKLTQVRLLDQTDIHNELVFEDEWLLHTQEPLRLAGDLFHVEETLSGQGLILLKEAPLPHARPVKSEPDFVWEPGPKRCRLLGNGTGSYGGDGYRFVVLTYSGGRAGRIAALQGYQRQVRMYDPKRDAMFLSNTWGDRSRDSRINAEFMAKEVEGGARLGVDVVQIDDGWEHGRTSNSARGNGVWSGFWAADPKFWEPDAERFPNGLGPIVKLAADKGMRFGLWFGPDSSNDFANWEKDAAKILELHRTTGIDYVKIDGVKAVSKAGEINLRRFFDRVQNESAGKVTFDLDVTAETRPGYFGMMNVGPLFVENRYTDFHRYWPHQTLRNLWKLAQYVDPLRLRMEFLNQTRNTNLYAGDPLAPSAYSPAYLFATTMFANPLGWFETSNLPANYFTEVAPLVKRWKQERPRLFAGTIVPVGQAPDGVAWTGFVSVSADRRSGYALVLREASDAGEWRVEFPLLAKAAYTVKPLGGSGSAKLEGSTLQVTIPQARQFLWVQVEAK